MCRWVTSDDTCFLYPSCLILSPPTTSSVPSFHHDTVLIPRLFQNRSYPLNFWHLAVVLSLSLIPWKEDGRETWKKPPAFWFIWEVIHGKRKSFILGHTCQTRLSGSLMCTGFGKKQTCERRSCESSGLIMCAHRRVIYLKAWQEGGLLWNSSIKIHLSCWI